MKKNKVLSIVILVASLAILGTIRNNANSQRKKNSIEKNNRKLEQHRISKVQTCIYGGSKSFVIPGLIASDVYSNLENKGFTVDKTIVNDHTSIYCESRSSATNLNVIITGCSPDEIIAIEAGAIDYDGNNQKELENFLAYVATLQYEGADPNKAKDWIKNNIKRNGSKITIGSVTFSIHFNSYKSKILKIEVEDILKK
jgi:hypothetical protein